jgi:hypothetical protein
MAKCQMCRGDHDGDVVGHHSGACEWSPTTGKAAMCTDPYHGDAVVSVGRKDNLRLCAECAALPRFTRRTHRRAIRG